MVTITLLHLTFVQSKNSVFHWRGERIDDVCGYCRYAAGTTPWGGSGSSFASFLPQRIDDGYLEVIGFTTASLVG